MHKTPESISHSHVKKLRRKEAPCLPSGRFAALPPGVKPALLRYVLLLAGFLFLSISGMAQGKYAGTHKHWVNREVEKGSDSVFFRGYTPAGFMLLQSDEEMEYYLYIFRKNTLHVVVLVKQVKDALSSTVCDVVEIRNMGRKDNIQSGSCTFGGSYNAKVFVLERNTGGKPRNIKAWYTDTDKQKFIAIPAKGIVCTIEEPD
jgi:hypothetical protein